jgi:tetratricopeptide (TPR) repeat protein
MRVILKSKPAPALRYLTLAGLLTLGLCACDAEIPQEGQGDCAPALQQAQGLLDQGHPDQAAAIILSALPSCPRNAAVRSLLGISLDEQKKYAEAQRAFLKAIALNPTWAPFRTNLAVNYLHANNATAAMEEFREALRLDPGNRLASFNLAQYYVDRKEFKQALKYVASLDSNEENDPDILLMLAEVYVGTGAGAKASAAASRLAAIAGDNAKLHFSLGLIFAELRQPAEAIRQFELISAGERDYATYQNLGLAYAKLGDPDKAHAAFETAIRLAPENPEPYMELGKLYVGSHQPDQALFLLSQANRMAPQRTDIAFALGELLIQMERFDEAGNLLTGEIKQHPSSAALLEAQGDLFERQHLNEQAFGAYSKSLQIDPKWIDSRVGLARLYWRAGDAAKAELGFEAVLHAAPDCAAGNAGMGALAFESGRIQEAITFLDKALLKEPDDFPAGEMLATAYVRKDQYAEADKVLQRLIQINPANSQVHYLEGRTLLKLGKNDESQSEFEKARQFASGIAPESAIQSALTGCSSPPLAP